MVVEEPLALFGQVDELRTTLEIHGLTDGQLNVLTFRGGESLSRLLTYVVVVASSAETAQELDDALGRDAIFTVERVGDETSVHTMRGVVKEVCPGGNTVGRGQRHTEITIAPRLAELEHVHGCRVFQNVTVVDIAKELLDPWQIALDVRLHPAPLPREYCTQVNESDFAFLLRILSEEGIHFHVEHREDESVVVLVNDPRGYEPIVGRETLPFRDADGAVTSDHVRRIGRRRRVRPGSVAYRDYNFLRPEVDMGARAETPTPTESGTFAARELYEYPGHYNAPDLESVGGSSTMSGQARAMLRLEEQRSDALTFAGTSNCLRMRVGRTFEIADHPDKAFNRKYVVTMVSIGGERGDAVGLGRANRGAGETLTVQFIAVPSDVRIRPPMRPKPPAHIRTARVVGPKEDEPYVDEYGRIKIQFMWDRAGQRDEKSSCWVRMATPVAHHNQGSYTAHRVGAEVLVSFLDGDVDRPVVTGAVYHGENRQPQQLPTDATRAVLYRGLSVPGNGGKNEISCEDRAGQEEILVHAQRDLNERVLRNHSATIAANESISVGANQTVSVGANQTVSVGANRTVSVTAHETINVAKSRTETVDDGESVTVKNGRSHTVSTKDDALTVTTGSRTVTVKETHKLETKDGRTHATNELELVGDVKTVIKQGATTATFEAGHLEITTGAYFKVKHNSTVITIEDGGKLKIEAAPEIHVSCGGAEVKMASGKVEVQAPSEVSLKVGQNGLKISASGVEVTGASIKSTALTGMNEISGLVVKCN
jgi:type VI secretion system secreted protein VgrG